MGHHPQRSRIKDHRSVHGNSLRAELWLSFRLALVVSQSSRRASSSSGSVVASSTSHALRRETARAFGSAGNASSISFARYSASGSPRSCARASTRPSRAGGRSSASVIQPQGTTASAKAKVRTLWGPDRPIRSPKVPATAQCVLAARDHLVKGFDELGIPPSSIVGCSPLVVGSCHLSSLTSSGAVREGTSLHSFAHRKDDLAQPQAGRPRKT